MPTSIWIGLPVAMLITALVTINLTVMYMRSLTPAGTGGASRARDHSLHELLSDGEPQAVRSAGAVGENNIALEDELRRERNKYAELHAAFEELQVAAEDGAMAAGAAAANRGRPAAAGAAARAGAAVAYDKHPVTVALCLSDATQGQMDEIQVALKSVLYNGPPSGYGAGLALYLVAADTKSVEMITAMLNTSQLDGSTWPIPTTIDVIDVSQLGRAFLLNLVRMKHGPLTKFWMLHNVGAFWRMLLPWVLPPRVEQLIYIDTDAWFRDNVAGMWIERRPDAMIQWGASRTSGVVMLNLKVMHRKMWPAYGAAACAALREPSALPYFVRKEINPRTGDQAFFQTIVHHLPALEANISAPYSEIHGAHTWRLGLEWWDSYEGGAVLHNNGGGNQIEWAYWRVYLPTMKNGTLEPPAHDRPVWRTATFFADLPWHWLAYHGATLSRVLGPGHTHPLKVSYSTADSTRFDAALDEAYTFWNRSLALVNATGEDCNQIFTGPSYASLKASGKAIGLADWVESGLRGPQ